jgi:virginiamycin B lyase
MEFPAPVGDAPVNTVPQGITAGPDGGIWFTEQNAGKIGRMDPNGTVTDEYLLPDPASLPRGIVLGRDGNLWFTERSARKIGLVNLSANLVGCSSGPGNTIVATHASYCVTESATLNFAPDGIAAGPDGNIWFGEIAVDANGNEDKSGKNQSGIGRCTPNPITLSAGCNGPISEWVLPFKSPGLTAVPGALAAGPDGNVWFTTLHNPSYIGRIAPSGTAQLFPIDSLVGTQPEGITTGPDGKIWFTLTGNTGGSPVGFLGQVDPTHCTGASCPLLAYPVHGTLRPSGITAGPGNTLWFTDRYQPLAVSIQTDGSGVTPYHTAGGGESIGFGPDGNVWLTENSSNEIGRVQLASGANCVANLANLCVGGGRFTVQVWWSVPAQGGSPAQSGVGVANLVVSDTGYFWFFSPDNIELMVKVLDGTSINGHFWVFYGSLSNVQYTITVTDTTTGAVRTYSNPFGQLGSFSDTSAFSTFAPPTQESRDGLSGERGDARVDLDPYTLVRASSLPVPALEATQGSCVPDAQSLCLSGARFKVQVAWQAPAQGTSGVGNAIPATASTGYFWFFSHNNLELVIKVLDARVINNHFWVFYGALSNVEYTITVTDTQTGAVKTYFNPDQRQASFADTSAF